MGDSIRNRKKNLHDISYDFKKYGYLLLSDNYVNCKSKLLYKCSKGHTNSITWTSWQQGKRCPECSSKLPLKKSFVVDKLKENGYTLITKEYLNSKQLLECICDNGHTCYIRWNDWQQGHRCYHCRGNIPLTILDVTFKFNAEGYKLLTNKYVNSRTILQYLCPHGHEHSTTMARWLNGGRCPTCHTSGLIGDGNPSWKGGISFEPYCEVWKDKQYKNDIKDRDGNKCLNPYCDSENSIDSVIHHVDYNKKNCAPDNLITICRSCNSKANKDRKWHTAWYKAILRNRYNY